MEKERVQDFSKMNQILTTSDEELKQELENLDQAKQKYSSHI